MKISFENKLVILFLIIFSVLIMAGIATYKNNQSEKETYYHVERTREVVYESEQILSSIQETVLSTRGFIITGNEDFLMPMAKSNQLIYLHLENLRNLIESHPAQLQNVVKLQKLIDERIKFSKLTVELRKKNGFKDAQELVSLGRGKFFMDSIRTLIENIQNQENQLQIKHKEANLRSADDFSRSFYLLMGTIVLMLFIVLYVVRHNVHAREKNEAALSESEEKLRNLINLSPVGISLSRGNGEILETNQAILDMFGMASKEEFQSKPAEDYYVNPPDRFEMIGQFKKDGFLKIFEVQLKRKNGEHFWASNSIASIKLPNNENVMLFATIDITQIKSAELQLMAVNKELEAFSYSVSHDLRSPLRAVGGYAKILYEDYAEKLDSEGIDYLNSIMHNARKMGALIDDLLAFSRLGRKEVSKTKIAMDSLVELVIKEEVADGTTKPEFIIHELLPALGDYALIKQVWVNLISNAVKYSKYKSAPVVEIGSYAKNNLLTYYVRDNGAGFDIQYYQKLFGVFQRLHSEQEFEGTGIGLAIVQKIINRHGGTVWAESILNEGSIFYFSIPLSA